MVAFLATMSFACISCNDDDETDQDNNTSIARGVVNVQLGSAQGQSLYAYDAKWSAGHQEVHGTVLDNLPNGATFTVDLSKQAPAELQEVLGEYIYEIEATWQFETPDAVSDAAVLEIDKSHWNNGTFDNAGYFCTDCDGTVKVKSIKGKDITLSFTNFKFDYISRFQVGNSTFTDIVINGDITFSPEN